MGLQTRMAGFGWRGGLAALLTGALVWAAFTPVEIVEAQVGIDPIPPTAAVPAAECGPGARPEPALQGQVPIEDRESGRSTEGYECNLELIGQHRHGEGATWQFDWYEDCAYYGTLDTPTRATKSGAVVVDASDPANPVESAVLDTPAMNDPHESLKVNERRGLLAAVDLDNLGFDVYDISKDCAKPELLSSVEVENLGHEGEWAPDGLTYYGSGSDGYYAIDVSDPANPTQITSYEPAGGGVGHGLSISDDGNRGYFINALPATGFIVADTSQVQERADGAQIRELSRIHWPDGTIGQHTIPVTIQGRPHIISVDEGGRGAARIVDMSNEAAPTVVSKLKLEVHLPQHEAATQPEWQANGGLPIFTYDGHYCSVDRYSEPTALACGYFESGIRVFDIRDPHEPKEIAYYNPPAITDEPLPASSHFGDHTADRCAAQVRLLPSARQLWTQCQDNEFLSLEFTNGAYPLSWPARSLAAACPEDSVTPAGYRDVDAESAHAAAIDCATGWDVATGKDGERYDPDGDVTRGQLASFVARMVEAAGGKLAAGRDRFADDDGSAHEPAINKLAAAGVLSGKTAARFAPNAAISRAEMATILAAGYEVAAGKPLVTDDDFFTDDGGVHEDAINRLTGHAIVSGIDVRRFAPGRNVTRGQMASFLARTLAQLVDDGKAAVPETQG